MIIDKVIEQAQARAAEGGQRIVRLNIGIKYLAAELSDGRCGLSFRYDVDPFHLIDKGPAAGDVDKLPLSTLIDWAADNRSLLRSGIGMAVINALTPWEEMQSPERQDSAEAAGIRDGDIVGMVGFFPPLVKKLEKRNIELRVFERSFKQPHPCLYPDWAENRLLPGCDVVIMTGTSCINGTIDQLLAYCTGARQVSVTGPTTPMYPKAFAGTNATILAGAKYRPGQKEELFRAISLGCCGAETLEYLDKFAWRL